MSRSSSPLAWVTRAAALSCGLLVGLAASAEAWLGAAAALAALSAWAAFVRESPLSRRALRSRRAQWAARLTMLGAVLVAGPRPWLLPLAALLAGAASGLLGREAREEPTAAIGPALAGLAAGLATSVVAPRVPLALGLLGLVLTSLGALASSFRGGPGRPPVRPVDVVWLYALGAALALAFAFWR